PRDLARLRAEQKRLDRLRPIQDQVALMGTRDPAFDVKSFMDAGWAWHAKVAYSVATDKY
ncbi:MAG: hypothetical protein RLN70_05605, partial [Rhodospirillaceae bacterium]